MANAYNGNIQGKKILKDQTNPPSFPRTELKVTV